MNSPTLPPKPHDFIATAAKRIADRWEQKLFRLRWRDASFVSIYDIFVAPLVFARGGLSCFCRWQLCRQTKYVSADTRNEAVAPWMCVAFKTRLSVPLADALPRNSPTGSGNY